LKLGRLTLIIETFEIVKYLILLIIFGFIFYKVARFFWRVYRVYNAVKKAIRENLGDSAEQFVKFGKVEIKTRPQSTHRAKPQEDEYTDFEEVK
jgi:hypothetical protein